MGEMKKGKDTDANLKMNTNSDCSPDDNNSSKPCNQGVRPKVKNYLSFKSNKSSQPSIVIQNGSTSQTEKISNIQNGSTSQTEKVSNIQNGASCSSVSSSSTSSVNIVSHDLNDKHNTDNSAEKCSAKGRTLSSEDNDLRYHDKKRKTGSFMDNESSSGNEGDEGLSGDDCCIYTYKGDQFADLPNSFFTVDMVANERNQPQRNNHRKANNGRESRPEENERSNPGSSPEMDYLEMDFDPGPSLEQDSEEDMDGFERKLINDSPVPELPSEQMVVDCESKKELDNMSVKMETSQDSQEPQPGPSNFQFSPRKYDKVSDYNSNNFSRTKDCVENCCGSDFSVDDGITKNHNSPKVTEERIDTEENDINSLTCLPFSRERLDKKTLTDKNDFIENENEMDLKTPFDGIMLWTEQEAISKQVTLISPDVSCGATAVINAMLVLKMRFSIEKVKEGISTRLKSESASIPQYLVSKSFAGVAHENLIRGIHHASHGTLYARFFQMYPRRDVVLSRWLSHWMKKGAVPIATMNVQREANPEDPTLDTRHHQMIFGVNSKGIYLTDPLECLKDEELWCRLTTPSVLKIKRNEIVSRWSPGTNLKPLMFQSDDRWKKMNVLGQVVNIIRESPDPGAQGKFLTQHISIPASSGITLVIPRDSSGYEALVSSADLPFFSSLKSD